MLGAFFMKNCSTLALGPHVSINIGAFFVYEIVDKKKESLNASNIFLQIYLIFYEVCLPQLTILLEPRALL